MASYRGTIPSVRTAEAAFDYMADFANAAEWDPTVVRAERRAPAGPDGEFLIVVRFAGRENEFVYRTVRYERPELVVLRAENSSVISEDTITVRPTASGSELTYAADLQPKGAMRLADPILALLFRRLGDNAAAGLRRELGTVG